MLSASIFITAKCNYRCVYCYRHIDKYEMKLEKVLSVIDHLWNMSKDSEFGFGKVSFAGGEPTLVPWIFNAIQYSKSKGFKTELITNGTKELLDDQLELLDVIAFDIDSLSSSKNKKIGKDEKHVERIEKHIERALKLGKKVKINTVVTKMNKDDVLEIGKWIREKTNIYRWKIFQFLPSYGIAKENEKLLKISTEEFNRLIAEVKNYMAGWKGQLLPEDNEYMSSSYASIDQHGNFYVSKFSNGGYTTVTIGPVEEFTMEKFINASGISKQRVMERCKINRDAFENKN